MITWMANLFYSFIPPAVAIGVSKVAAIELCTYTISSGLSVALLLTSLSLFCSFDPLISYLVNI